MSEMQCPRGKLEKLCRNSQSLPRKWERLPQNLKGLRGGLQESRWELEGHGGNLEGLRRERL